MKLNCLKYGLLACAVACSAGAFADAEVAEAAEAPAKAPAAARAYGTKLGELAFQDDVDSLANKVSVLDEWAVGDDTAIRVENAGQTNAEFSVIYTNATMFSTSQYQSNILSKSNEYADQKVSDLAAAVEEDFAHLAWGKTTSGGATSPDDTLIIEKSAVAVTGGANYSRYETSLGAYYILTVSLGSKYTLASLANELNPGQPSTLSVYDSSNNKIWEISSQDDLEVPAVAGDDMLAPVIDSSGENDVIRMVFPMNADTHPTCMYAPSLSVEFKEANAENWPLYISSSEWTGGAGAWTNVITCVGKPSAGFFKGKFVRSGGTYMQYSAPIGLTRIIIGGTRYVVSVENVSGRNLMVLEVDNN